MARATESAPRVRLRSLSAVMVGSSVDVAFDVERDAYALVVAVDRDSRIRVLFPGSPADTGLVRGRSLARLDPMFAGFGYSQPKLTHPYLYRGVIIAIASARPLQLDRLADETGDWDEEAIASILDNSLVREATEDLGRAVTLVGQDFSTDHESFRGQRHLTTQPMLASAASDGCSRFTQFATVRSTGWTNDIDDFTVAPLVVYTRQGNALYARYLLTPLSPCSPPAYSAPVLVRPLAPPVADSVKKDSTATAPASPYRMAAFAERARETPARVTSAPRDAEEQWMAPIRFRPPERAPGEPSHREWPRTDLPVRPAEGEHHVRNGSGEDSRPKPVPVSEVAPVERPRREVPVEPVRPEPAPAAPRPIEVRRAPVEPTGSAGSPEVRS